MISFKGVPVLHNQYAALFPFSRLQQKNFQRSRSNMKGDADETKTEVVWAGPHVVLCPCSVDLEPRKHGDQSS